MSIDKSIGFSLPSALLGDKGATKGNQRRQPCGNIEGTEVSAKRFFCFLGSVTPLDKALTEDSLRKMAEKMGLTLVSKKGHLCSKGEVKTSTAKQWYRWGHPGFPDEGGKAKSKSYLTMPQVILDKLGK